MNVARHNMTVSQRSVTRLLARTMICGAVLVCNSAILRAQIGYELMPPGAPVLVWKPNPRCSKVLPEQELSYPHLAENEMTVTFAGDSKARVIDLNDQAAPLTIDLPFESVGWVLKVPSKQLILVVEPGIVQDDKVPATLWCVNIASGKKMWKRRFGGPEKPLSAMVISHDGEMLALGFSVYEFREEETSLPTGGWVHRSWIELIDIDDGKQTDTLKCTGWTSISCMEFSYDDSMLAVGEMTLCGLSWWDLSSNTENVLLRRVEHGRGMDGIHSVAFSPDDKFLIAAGALHNGVAEETMHGAGLLLGWNMADDRLAMVETSPDSYFDDICFDRKGRFFVTSERAVLGEFEAWPPKWETIFKLWSLEDKSIMVECRRQGEHMLAPLTTDDGKMITLLVNPIEQPEDPSDIPLHKVPVRVERCEWNLEADEFFDP